MERLTSVNLREKKISKDRLSLFLDFYPPVISPKTGKKTRREFLGIYIKEKPKNRRERQENEQKRRKADSRRAEVEL